MADDLSSLLSGADLTGFQDRITANDLYGLIGRSLASWQPNYQYMNGGESLLTSFGKAFAGGLLQNYAQNRAADQLSSVVNVLPQLSSDPLGVAAPEGVDSSAFNTLRGSAYLKKVAQENELSSILKKYTGMAKGEMLGKAQAFKELGIENPDDPSVKQKYEELKAAAEAANAGKKAMATKIGEIAGSQVAYGNTGQEDPESPIAKKVADMQNKFNALDEVKNFKYVQRLSTQLFETLKDPTAVDDPALAKMAVQLIEPGLSTTSGETAALAQSTSIPESWKSFVGKSLKGASGLPPEVRTGLLKLAKNSYGAYGKIYQQSFDQAKQEAARYGIEPSRISPIGDAPSFESFLGTKQLTPKEKALQKLKERGLLG